MKIFTPTILLFVFLASPIISLAQLTKIMGVVLDDHTEEPIPFANVFFKNTTIGVSTGFDGEFSFEVDIPADTLAASSLGYLVSYQKIKKGVFQKVTFRLKPSEISLNEVEIFAESDPALIIFNKMIANKEKNNPKEFEYFQYRLYNKIEIDANNVNDRFQKSSFMKKFQVVFQYVDTSTINGKAYLPVFLTESVSQVYKKSNPKVTKEVIIGSQISGYENESLSPFMGGLYQEVNIYDNYISVFDKNFIGPISDNGRNSYDYIVIDTVILKGKSCFHLMFKPRRKQELTFVGELWVHDTTFAAAKVEMKAAVDANINYINDIAISQEYDFFQEKYWVLIQDKIVLDLNVVENSMKVPGFFSSRNSY
ncbi:MAG: hypothetical protein GQ527_02120, partial [Bacteroidales bacterium]|nr:hypothetical protein [Bacteroidales bacterium]